MAKLYFRYGAMGSSKTANAIMVQYNYGERHQNVLMVKPQLENRDGKLVSRTEPPEEIKPPEDAETEKKKGTKSPEEEAETLG